MERPLLIIDLGMLFSIPKNFFARLRWRRISEFRGREIGRRNQ